MQFFGSNRSNPDIKVLLINGGILTSGSEGPTDLHIQIIDLLLPADIYTEAPKSFAW